MALLRRKSENPVAALERDLSDLLARRDVVERRQDTQLENLVAYPKGNVGERLATGRSTPSQAAHPRHGVCTW